eukprot:m.9138 g.9138  ORF g.9138 m.9138 type:complete len:158 (+) comp3371_c0_seq1:55-528(+)
MARIPIAAFAFMFVLGVVFVDMCHDDQQDKDLQATLNYYTVMTQLKPPLAFGIPLAIVIALVDTIFSAFKFRDTRESGILILGCYVLYLYVGVVQGAFDQTDFNAPLEDNDNRTALFNTVRFAHIYMLPTLLVMTALNIWTHVICPPGKCNQQKKTK